VGIDADNIKVDKDDVEQRNFISASSVYRGPKKAPLGSKITRKVIRQSLQIPSEYYIGRGIKPEVLDKYDVGLCTNPSKWLYDRAVFPIYNVDYKYMVGCTGRSIWDDCNECHSYHNPKHPCPSHSMQWKYKKWLHNKGFDSNLWLYNLWHAQDTIKETGVAVLVESPGTVLRIEQAGIHNSLGTFGAKLSPGQKTLIDSSGALTLIALTDPDAAGKLAGENIQKTCENQYDLVIIGDKDTGEMKDGEVFDFLSPLIEKHRIKL